MLSSSPFPRFTARRAALAGILVVALGALTLSGASAASASGGDTPESWSDLNHDLFAQDANITLTSPTSSPTTFQDPYGSGELYTYDNVTIDLNGNSLNVTGIVMTSGTTMTIEDTSDSPGNVYANGGISGIPGIVVSSGSTLILDGGTVYATGAYGNPGIGSGSNVPDPIDYSGNTKQTGIGTIEVNGGILNATGGAQSAAIGGGIGQPGGTVSIGAGAVVNATADSGQSVIGAGHTGSGFGSLEIAGTLNLAGGQELDVPNGDGVTVDASGSITGSGALDVEGTISNAGAVALPVGNIAGQTNISGNNFLVTFDSNTASETGALPTPANSDAVRVFASTFVAGNRHEPTDYTAPGDYVYGWDQGGGGQWNKTTTITGDETVYANWTKLDSLTLSSDKTSVPDGTAIALTVTGNGPSGTTNDQTPFVTLTSSEAADTSTVGSGDLTLHGYGTRTVTANVTSDSASTSVGDSNALTLISTGPAIKLSITPTKPTVHAGVVSSFVVSGTDAAGTNLGDVTDQVTWSGLSTSKHDSVDPGTNEPIFGTTGTRTLKAAIGSHSVSTTVKVVAGAPARLAFHSPVTKAVAGIPAAFTVYGYDFAGNSLGNVTNDSTFGVQDAVSGESGTGNLVTFTLAGDRVATVTDGDASATTPITVTHGVGEQFDNTPVGYPFDPYYQAPVGTTETYDMFPVEDAYGNVFSDADVTNTMKISFYSYPGYAPITTTDVIKKNTVTWFQSTPRWVLLTVGDAELYVLQAPTPGDAVAGKLTFNHPTSTQYVTQPFSLTAYPSDGYGNATDGAVPATFAATTKGTTIVPSDADDSAAVTFTSTGKHTVTVKGTDGTTEGATGSGSFTIIKDTSAVSFSTSAITASIPSTFTVAVPTGGSGVEATGTVTLHYGSKSLKSTVSDGSATFSLPALKVGKYTFYASYSGNSLYSSKTTSKHTISVVPGVLDHLKFISPDTSVTAGQTVSYVVHGYDAAGNLIGTEPASLTLSDLAGTETDAGSKVKYEVAGVRTLTATYGTFSISTPITVTHASLHTLNLSADPITATAGDTVTFPTAVGADAYGNTLGNLISKTSIKSSVSSDKVSKQTVKFTKAGTRTLTFTDGSVKSTLTVTVAAGDPADGRFAFVSSSTTAYPAVAFGVLVVKADAWGNPTTDFPDTTPVYTASGTGTTVDAGDPSATFATTGTHTVTATIGAVHISKSVHIVKDSVVGLAWPLARSLPADTDSDSVLTLTAGASGVAPLGTVTLHYGSKKMTAVALAGATSSTSTVDVSLPAGGLAKGKYTVYLTYSGSATYNSKTSSKVTLTITAAS